MKYEIKTFGGNYSEIFIYNEKTMISFSDLGARVNRWQAANGDHIILGHDHADHVFQGQSYYMGATIGRVAGRLSERHYGERQLSINSEGHHLHGGPEAFDSSQWKFEIQAEKDRISVLFSLRDPDQKNGYPGNLAVSVRHSYSMENEWTIEYMAHTDQETLFNPTNHVYFNLNADRQDAIYNHYLQIKADKVLAIKEGGLPLGIKSPVEGTIFDLNEPVRLDGPLNNTTEPQISLLAGYDHPFELRGEQDAYDAVLYTQEPDRKIWMKTDRPAVVVYTLNSVGEDIAIWDQPLQAHHGVTLETQVLPDALKNKDFGNIILKTDEEFYSKTSYRLEEA